MYASGNGNGYDGYAMSNNARMAYEDCREMPLSKWTKTELLSAIRSYNVSADIILALQKHNTDTLRRELLMYSGWHHTSEYYNKTNFYAIDADKVNELTVNCIDNWDKVENTVSSLKYRGDFNYVEWQGSRNYPKAVPHCLENVNIEERGSFYYVTDADDTFDSKDEFLEALKECKLPDGSFDNRYDFTIYNNYHEIISGEYNQVLEDIQDIGLWHNEKWDFYLTRDELETMGVPKDFIDHTLAIEKDLDMEKE